MPCFEFQVRRAFRYSEICVPAVDWISVNKDSIFSLADIDNIASKIS